MPRFVILHHEMPPHVERPSHWDLMLEDEGALLTWAMDCELAVDVAVSADQLPNHRIDYLTYEGPISGDRGAVTQWDRGVFEWITRSEEELLVQLNGTRIQGTATLRRKGNMEDVDAPQLWSVSLRKI